MKYITGMPAINIPYEGDAPGWHTQAMLKTRAFKVHGVNFTGAEELFGDEDLFDAGPWLREMGFQVGSVPCARPERAIADAIYHEVVAKGRSPNWIRISDLDIDSGKLGAFIKRMIDAGKDQNNNMANWVRKNIDE